MVSTPNEQMAAGVGQGKGSSEPIQVYDRQVGSYQCPVTYTRNAGSQKQPPSSKAPLKGKGA